MIYKVGGCVRDEILGIPSKDIDYACEFASYEAMREYISARGKIFLEQPQYFTIRAKVDGDAADFVLCRKERGYSDGRRPDSVEIGTLYDDLSRRDFTMNAIAVHPDGGYIDHFGGLNDIEHKIIRCVGSAEERFKEDSLRMIRAIRFAITKNMMVDDEIRRCLLHQDFIDLLTNISEERIREELTRCFQYDTLQTIWMLGEYKRLTRFIFDNTNIWLKPTTEK